MDIDCADSEPVFLGLVYGLDKKSNESDLSDDEKVSKKELLIGKRKDKDTKKDRGYAALEGESSPEEQETKSPLKSKKTKSFKFASKSKEKREKSREKDKESKEKDVTEKKKEKDKKTDKVKEKPKTEKKEKKKDGEETLDIGNAQPIFGVSLYEAVSFCPCHDGVLLALPVRECIDYIQEHGLNMENIYKSNSVKSKVQHLRHLYNHRQKVNWSDYDVLTATGLLKTYLRELPFSILTEKQSNFETAVDVQTIPAREALFIKLIDKLPSYNQTLLGWLILHLECVTLHEKQNKMNTQCIAAVFSPILQISQKLIVALIFHAKSIFPDIKLRKYVPPLTSSAVLPTDATSIGIELKKQESLLSQLHREILFGFITKEREELLWEVQRIITQLKRSLRAVQKSHDIPALDTIEDSNSTSTEVPSVKVPPEESVIEKPQPQPEQKPVVKTETTEKTPKPVEVEDPVPEVVNNVEPNVQAVVARPLLSDEDKNILLLQLQNSELVELQTYLLSQIHIEKNEIAQLKQVVTDREAVCSDGECSETENVEWDKLIDLIEKENRILQIKKNNLVREIMEEREQCVDLQSQLLYIALSKG